MSDVAEEQGATPGSEDDVSSYRMPLLQHLEELRTRLIHAMIIYAVCLVGCVVFSPNLFQLLIHPAVEYLPEGTSFVYTKLPEAFITYLKVALLASVFLSSPFLFFQGWKFVAPGLYKSEKRMVFPFVLFSTLLFLSGAVFCYLAVLPWACKFFLAYGADPETSIQPLLTISEYLAFSTRLLLAFGLVFELPLEMMFVGRAGLIRHQKLRKLRPFALVAAFVGASLITPPDVVTQVALGLPLMLLYEVGIWLVWWVQPKEKAKGDDEGDDKGDDDGDEAEAKPAK